MKIGEIRHIKIKYKNIIKRPDELAFALLVILALFFAAICFGTIKRDSKNISVAPTNIRNISQPQKKIKKLIANSPMEKMTPYLERQDEKVAAYLVAIAKKESDWGKFTPKKKGKECYNLWGYRGTYNRNAAGYSCFDSPAQAVNVVGKRIRNLIAQKVDTPREMVLWKCGNACTARSNPDAAKWVSDVSLYYRKAL
jgi:hypothetical protein